MIVLSQGLQAPSADQQQAASPASSRRVAAASLVGTTLEFYDHFIFGTAAALIFPKLFFSQSDPFVATILSLLSYGIAFAARPFGAALFGSMGDKLGRRFVLVSTLLIMGLSTFLIGLLPTYGQVGLLAPVLLALLRFAQGLALGGEWGGAALMVNEFDTTGRRRGFYGSLVQVASPIGVLLANAMFGFMNVITDDAEFMAWGWRIPFLASILLVGVGYYIRRSVSESPVFQSLEKTLHKAEAPLLETLRNHWRQVLLAIGVRAGEGIIWYVFSLLLLVYVPTRLGLPRQVALNAVLLGAAVGVLAIPLFGALSDRIGRKTLLLIGVAASIIWSFAYFPLLETRDPMLVIIASMIGMVCQAALWAPLAAFIPEMFEPKIRCTGASLGFQLAGVFGGALAPAVCVWLLDRFNNPLYISAYCTVGLAVIALCVIKARPQQ
ncbi:putative transporter, MFS-type [Variovorax paradoxus B4]|uniref:Putative transporter, MFS-type n=1 Tax=Variovorax paradoxus B4 TaxID=1246301 RepID=T1X6U8_VARPD|nr:MFS transporter [Variovorax paradoxus]AGU48186.1 putative transporter, MFS-type [Variovorax paradoxus B4]